MSSQRYPSRLESRAGFFASTREECLSPPGNQAVPTIEPDWDYNTAKGRWDQSHFVRCVLEGLRQLCAKPLSYGKLADTEQEEKEAPGKFLDRLREAL